jgi:uncharacterized protein YkwD
MKYNFLVILFLGSILVAQFLDAIPVHEIEKNFDICLNSFRAKALQLTNSYRIKHQAPPMFSNESIDNYALLYSKILVSKFSFEHNPDLEKVNLGENLYMKGVSSLSDYSCEG